MRRNRIALLIAGAAVSSMAVTAGAATPTVWNHDSGSPIGPPQWGAARLRLRGVWTGTSQSPVNISRPVRGGGPSLKFKYRDNELVVENTGHVIEVPIPAEDGDTLKIGKSAYTLQQYHFHAPSEHTLNGRHYDLEAHLVHQDAAGQTAVVAVFMKIGHHPNELVDDIFRNAPDVAGEETEVGIESNPKELLPGHGTKHHKGKLAIPDYFTYSGSLTTPPCSEPVRWLIAKEPVNVSAFSVGEMHELVSLFPNYGGYPNNNRPVQPLNGRTVISRG